MKSKEDDMESKKEKRKQFHYYVTNEEYKQIQGLAARVAMPEAAVVRTCVLAVANTPALEYIFDDGVLLKADTKSLLRYSPTLRIIDEVMNLLEKQGIVIDYDELLSSEMKIKKEFSNPGKEQ